jgi:poly(A) polymerase
MVSQFLPTIDKLAGVQGAQLMLVGGAVRDQLLGLAPLDWDFVVAGDAIKLARAFADAIDAAVYVMDAERGVARVLLRNASSERPAVFDFVTRRGASWEDDLRDRDFTINAIAQPLDGGAHYDPLGGATDLRQHTLRAVGPDALVNDPVRAIRGVRMAHQFGLTIDPATRDQMRAAAGHLDVPSAERLRDALFAVLELPHAAEAVYELATLHLLRPWTGDEDPGIAFSPRRLQVLRALDGDAERLCAGLSPDIRAQLATHLRLCVSDDRSRRALLRASVMMHAAAASQIGGAGYPRSQAFDRLRLSAHELAIIRNIIVASDHAQGVFAVHDLPDKSRIHALMLAADTAAPEAVCAAAAYRMADEAALPREQVAMLLQAYFERYAPDVAPAPLLTGRDLIELGVRPGPGLGEMLAALREAQMTDRVATRADALAFARTQIQSRAARS